MDGTDGCISEAKVWKVVDSWFYCRGLAAMQIDSYNHFVKHTMKNIMASFPPIQVTRTENFCCYNHILSFSDPQLEPNVHIKPNDCRIQSSSYMAAIKVKISYTIQQYSFSNNEGLVQEVTYEPKLIDFCLFPVMVNSCLCYLNTNRVAGSDIKAHRIINDECPYDEGGYFIIRGAEKAVIAQEGNRPNRLLILPGDPGSKIPYTAQLVSTNSANSLHSKVVLKYWSTNKWGRTIQDINQPQITFTMQGIRDDLPLFLLILALWQDNVYAARDLLSIVVPDESDTELIEHLLPSYNLFCSTPQSSKDKCIEFLAGRLVVGEQMDSAKAKYDRLMSHLSTRLLPHIGVTPEFHLDKAFFIGYMTNLLLQTVVGRRSPDDRDHWGGKRLQLTGSLLADKFRFEYELFLRRLARKLHDTGSILKVKEDISMVSPNIEGSSFIPQSKYDTHGKVPGLEDPRRLLDRIKVAATSYISKNITSALSTGTWKTNEVVGNTKSGVSQSLVRLSYTSALSQIRRSSSSVEETSKAIGPRLLHTTQFGYMCPAETPEGAKVGLIKNFSLMANVTLDNPKDEHDLRKLLTEYRVQASHGPISVLKSFHTVTNAKKLVSDVKIFLNGSWLGFIDREYVQRLITDLKRWRFEGKINREVSISYLAHKQEISISSDEGRVTRPVFVVITDIHPTLKLVTNLSLAITEEDVETLATIPQMEQWNSLLSGLGTGKCMIEFLDPNEEEMALICMDIYHFKEEIQKAHTIRDIILAHGEDNAINYIKAHNIPLANNYTHLEIHPSMVLSAITSLIPFPDHNQSPRNLYQASMGKQAVGIYALNYLKRFDTSGINVMHYPQLPLVTTRSMPHVKFRYLPAGQNVIIAIAVYSGFNQEDSLIMSQSAVDRGFMRATYYHTYEEMISSAASSINAPDRIEKFCRPIGPNIKGIKDPGCASYLEADGLPRVGNAVNSQRLIIGKIRPNKRSMNSRAVSTYDFQDVSLKVKMEETGRVDSVIIAPDLREQSFLSEGVDSNTTGAEGSLLAKVRVRSSRVPQLGDKFSSRHGQKGTVGMLLRHEDLPFTLDGITPDIIMNPHAIPSRMTIGQLMESVASKLGALSGHEVDGTAFNAPPGSTDKQIAADLHARGYQKHNYEAMMNGMTGEMMTYRIFIGPTFYQRLKHMVLDKISSRNTGPIVTLTRQPNEGRSNYGGMRIGEMEKDAFIAHGATAILRDRLLFSSDVSEFLVCQNCGIICWHADSRKLTTKKSPHCMICSESSTTDSFARITIPYAAKLFFQEIIGMGVFPRIEVETH
ncbi:DNA-directed RNA polymerase beta subunit [Giardia duodenalis]|uniref:DNA-directed RNA polymerase subunit beta n=1 Tax=Giardia intestinalis TaxID=5741 RepID=V6TJ79_GIAIN|nr:DNA-directed RNA polymerase beta subunit [Giardia intestinalis]